MELAARLYFSLMTLGFVVNYAETWYYGWNYKAASPAEAGWDTATTICVVVGLLGLWITKWRS